MIKMRKYYAVIIFLSTYLAGFTQIDTISTNIYQQNGRLGIGTTEPYLKLHIVDTNTRILLGYQPAYNGPYINIYGSPSDAAPMLGLGVARKEYYKSDDTLTMVNWSYLYGNNFNPGIAILPDLQFPDFGVYINRDGMVGINTKRPKGQLDVNGGIRIGYTVDQYAGVLRWTGSAFEGYNGSNWLSLSDSSSNFWSQNTDGLYYETGNIGIGSAPNNHLLSIQTNIGEGIERNLLKINNLSNSNSSYTGIILKTGEGNYQSVIQDYGSNYTASPHYHFSGYLNLSNNANGLMLHANSPNGIIKFYTGYDEVAGAGIERLRIDSTGNIGIATKAPVAKLQVADGDIYISDIEKGIIMKSPDGSCWRGVLDNSGQLNFTKIDCPKEEIANDIQPLKSSENVLIFPNPADNIITISLITDQIQLPKYSIYNLNGQLEDNGLIRSKIQTIDISKLGNGVYFLNITDNKGVNMKTEKFIKE